MTYPELTTTQSDVVAVQDVGALAARCGISFCIGKGLVANVARKSVYRKAKNTSPVLAANDAHVVAVGDPGARLTSVGCGRLIVVEVKAVLACER
jgi:hypothetical protein